MMIQRHGQRDVKTPVNQPTNQPTNCPCPTGADSRAAEDESAVQPDPRVRERAAAGDWATQPAERGRHSAAPPGGHAARRLHLGGDRADGQAAAVWVWGEQWFETAQRFCGKWWD